MLIPPNSLGLSELELPASVVSSTATDPLVAKQADKGKPWWDSKLGGTTAVMVNIARSRNVEATALALSHEASIEHAMIQRQLSLTYDGDQFVPPELPAMYAPPKPREPEELPPGAAQPLPKPALDSDRSAA